MPSPKVSIIIISYNTKDVTIDTLDSVYRHTKGIDFEVIVIDNDSQDGSVEALEQYAKSKANMVFKPTHKNPGFGTANNYGASLAKGEYLLFLNSDTLFEDDVLTKSIDYLSSKPDIGVYSCRLLNKDGSLQPSGGFFPTLFRVFAWQFFVDDLPILGKLIKSIHPSRSYYQKHPVLLDWVTGAFMIIPKNVFQKLKGFDEHIFMYTEEMELCYRSKKIGFTTQYHPDLHIIHLGGASSAEVGSFFSITSEIQYTIYFFRKHKPKWQVPLVKLFIGMGSVARLVMFGIIKNNAIARRSYTHVFKFLT